MPCGGIYPIAGTWVEPYYNAEDPHSRCLWCGKGEPKPDHFCDEWDCFLHGECIEEFLKGDEGKIVLIYGHQVWRGEEMLYAEREE